LHAAAQPFELSRGVDERPRVTFSLAPMSHPTSDPVERDLHAIVGDGIAFSVMVGIGETYLPAFALAVGHGEVAVGLLATLPMLAGAILQLMTPMGVRRLGSCRRWVVLCARLQALTFVPLLSGALLGHLDLFFVFLAAGLYWGFGMATSPAWNAWVARLVPLAGRSRFFARRTRWANAGLFTGVAAGGLLLDLGRVREAPIAAFALLFGAAAAARLLSSYYLGRQSEPPGMADSLRNLSTRELVARFRHGPSGRFLFYLLGMQVAVHVAAPFFTPYMLSELQLPYREFMALTGVAFLARIALLPSLGRLAHARGTGVLLWLGAVGIVPLPLLWLVSSSFVYLFVLQILAGAIWAALELGTILAFFERLEDSERTSILTVFNLANSAAMVLGTVLGGALFAHLGAGALAYGALFAASSAVRLLTLPLLRHTPHSEAPEHTPALRTIAVRPSMGGLQRPLLPALDDDGKGKSAR
jgi:MFS family permease